MAHSCSNEHIPLGIAVLTVSDTRNFENDTSGAYLIDALKTGGHLLVERALVKDDIYQIRAQVSQWIVNEKVQVILITGGTGFTERDSTPEAVVPLLDKRIEGFGELFRQLSWEEIGTSTIQSRAIAGLANRTLICCLPGSTGACRTGWEKILEKQLNARQGPCNFVPHLIQQPICSSRG
ncbi:molybdenum cofactor biosynthesis protein B [Cellvibrio sp. PSBB006]|uniref:molybdenum cofactor biosynthesis protein B n=1 Tax=Cellvibrio sp. PSBB006 TaxID=1987723 RepID=UPI000B3B9DD7|nr:molybdenum cofactor biosynthesis protein B [Cellvibrio sp. PSBB006]ARU26107.1 molybdenum cofactor biosynthesis protein B [Cellvibrio sp. PSBB006]